MSDVIRHYGMPRRSGRYPWGSGGDPQRHLDFSGYVHEMRKQGMSDVDIAKSQGITTTKLRERLSLAKTEKINSDIAEAVRLKDKGYSTSEVARRMDRNESSIRALLDPVLSERASITNTTAAMLKESVDRQKYIDIGPGVERYIGVPPNRLKLAVAKLQEDGYKVHTVNVDQVGMPGKFTRVKVLGAPDTTWPEVVRDISKIQPAMIYSPDRGRTFENTSLGLKPIQNIDSKRIKVVYAEDGGSLKDGVIELRRGVSDLDLGQSKYAQVRIGVDGTHYLKGMAIYKDDMPDGIDIIFNTNKKSDTPIKGPKDNSVLKPFDPDPDNPFGSTIKRDGQRGALNIVNEEGDWDKWSRTLSSQVLSKQTVPLAKKQLSLALKQKQEEYDEISKLTNPVVKQKLLQSFSDDCDSSAVHLKAASLPRQASKVILPVPGLKDTEVYAPSFKNGESVVLIRHPHAGIFEIPQLTVNNNSRSAKSVLSNAVDAIGINPKVAQKLSGADFDGDSVIVIPNNRGYIKTAPSLKSLENFDPIELYRIPPGSSIPKIKKQTKQTKMGEISNLITDMTIKGANPNDIARAVRHSMVVIDSEKHNLDYRQSYRDNGISSLSEKYQGTKRGGASTLVSRSKSEIRVDERRPRSMKEGGPIDIKTGEKIYTPTGESYPRVKYKDPATGKIKETSISKAKRENYEVVSVKEIKRTVKSTKMAEAKDARELSSGRPIEEAYADYANSLKTMANTARRDMVSVKTTPYSPSAKKVYEKEVAVLNSKLNIALKNKPLERQAQIIANTTIKKKMQAHPDLDDDEIKKLRNQALAEARVRTGAKKVPVEITNREWEAIQAGAISTSKLKQIIDNADLDRVKQLATPRSSTTLTTTKLNRAKLLLTTNTPLSDIAESLGVSVRTLTDAINQDKASTKVSKESVTKKGEK